MCGVIALLPPLIAPPHPPPPQLRTLSCLLLLAFVRVLNISVPIIYKHLIDMLAAANPSTSRWDIYHWLTTRLILRIVLARGGLSRMG